VYAERGLSLSVFENNAVGIGGIVLYKTGL
jgi:hypothetical protein